MESDSIGSEDEEFISTVQTNMILGDYPYPQPISNLNNRISVEQNEILDIFGEMNRIDKLISQSEQMIYDRENRKYLIDSYVMNNHNFSFHIKRNLTSSPRFLPLLKKINKSHGIPKTSQPVHDSIEVKHEKKKSSKVIEENMNWKLIPTDESLHQQRQQKKQSNIPDSAAPKPLVQRPKSAVVKPGQFIIPQSKLKKKSKKYVYIPVKHESPWMDPNTKDYNVKIEPKFKYQSKFSHQSDSDADNEASNVDTTIKSIKSLTVTKPSQPPPSSKLKSNKNLKSNSSIKSGKSSLSSFDSEDRRGSKPNEYSKAIGERGRKLKLRKENQRKMALAKAAMPPLGDVDSFVKIIGRMLSVVCDHMIHDITLASVLAVAHHNKIKKKLKVDENNENDEGVYEEDFDSLADDEWLGKNISASNLIKSIMSSSLPTNDDVLDDMAVNSSPNASPNQNANPTINNEANEASKSSKKQNYLTQLRSSRRVFELTEENLSDVTGDKQIEAFVHYMKILSCSPNHKALEDLCPMILWLFSGLNGYEDYLVMKSYLYQFTGHIKEVRSILASVKNEIYDRGPTKENDSRQYTQLTRSLRNFYSDQDRIFEITRSLKSNAAETPSIKNDRKPLVNSDPSPNSADNRIANEDVIGSNRNDGADTQLNSRASLLFESKSFDPTPIPYPYPNPIRKPITSEPIRPLGDEKFRRQGRIIVERNVRTNVKTILETNKVQTLSNSLQQNKEADSDRNTVTSTVKRSIEVKVRRHKAMIAFLKILKWDKKGCLIRCRSTNPSLNQDNETLRKKISLLAAKMPSRIASDMLYEDMYELPCPDDFHSGSLTYRMLDKEDEDLSDRILMANPDPDLFSDYPFTATSQSKRSMSPKHNNDRLANSTPNPKANRKEESNDSPDLKGGSIFSALSVGLNDDEDKELDKVFHDKDIMFHKLAPRLDGDQTRMMIIAMMSDVARTLLLGISITLKHCWAGNEVKFKDILLLLGMPCAKLIGFDLLKDLYDWLKANKRSDATFKLSSQTHVDLALHHIYAFWPELTVSVKVENDLTALPAVSEINLGDHFPIKKFFRGIHQSEYMDKIDILDRFQDDNPNLIHKNGIDPSDPYVFFQGVNRKIEGWGRHNTSNDKKIKKKKFIIPKCSIRLLWSDAYHVRKIFQEPHSFEPNMNKI